MKKPVALVAAGNVEENDQDQDSNDNVLYNEDNGDTQKDLEEHNEEINDDDDDDDEDTSHWVHKRPAAAKGQGHQHLTKLKNASALQPNIP